MESNMSSMTLQDYIKLADAATDGPWEFTRLYGDDHRGMGWIRSESGTDIAATGDMSLSISENEANASLINASRTLGPAMAKALIEAEEALLYVCARDVAKDVGDKAHKALAQIQALNGGEE